MGVIPALQQVPTRRHGQRGRIPRRVRAPKEAFLVAQVLLLVVVATFSMAAQAGAVGQKSIDRFSNTTVWALPQDLMAPDNFPGLLCTLAVDRRI